MQRRVSFQAEKPVLSTHPVNGGDALVFTIAPRPPKWWWRAMRDRAGANPLLVRPWDQEHESRMAVVCPTLENLTSVIDAIDSCVAQANDDYRRELELQDDSAEKLKTDLADRDRRLHEIQDAIDERYDGEPQPSLGAKPGTRDLRDERAAAMG
jgi:hypothetical protein